MAETGDIAPAAIERSVVPIAGMADEARRHGASALAAVGTRGLRSAWSREGVFRMRIDGSIEQVCFTAYGTMSPAGHHWLIVGFPFFGMVVAAVIGVSVYAAVAATAVVQSGAAYTPRRRAMTSTGAR